jgi:Nif-specific regulatory protein
VATLVTRGDSLDGVLGPVLRVLSEQTGMRRASLGRVDLTRGEVYIEAAHGLTPSEVSRMRYALGEGISGRVVVDGMPLLVRSIRADPRFIDDTDVIGRRGDAIFLCVPVRCGGPVLGTLSAYRSLPADADPQADLAALEVAAGLLAPLLERAVLAQPARTADEVAHPPDLIGRSKGLQHVLQLVQQVAPTTTTALLRGESGTGKERVAHLLHEQSPRAGGPFVKVNCAALPEGVIESELFGHERGAFTGAHRERKGRFELAHGGTLFLDEIGDLGPALQVKLLRVLQEREFERVGGTRTIRVDVRVVAATSRDLETMIARGQFRADLYYRLNVFPIHLPPLRDRRADVLLLADHFVGVFNRAHDRMVRRVSTSAIDMLMAYHWPGNVRELENCIERAVLLAHDDVILGHHLPPTLQTAEASGTRTSGGLQVQVEAFERELVLDALKSARGNMAAAARSLGITERIMGLRVARFAIEPKRFKTKRR